MQDLHPLRHAVGLRLHLIGAEVEKRLPEALREIVQQLSHVAGRLCAADVASHTNVVERAQRGSRGETARQQYLLEGEVGMVLQVAVELLAETPSLSTINARLVSRQIYPVLLERGISA